MVNNFDRFSIALLAQDENVVRTTGYNFLKLARSVSTWTAKWNDTYKQKNTDLWPPTPLSDVTTYDSCVDVRYDLLTGVFEIKVYDGDLMYGDRQDLRLTYFIKKDNMTDQLKSAVSDIMERRLMAIARNHRKQEIEEQESKRIREIFSKLIDVDKDNFHAT